MPSVGQIETTLVLARRARRRLATSAVIDDDLAELADLLRREFSAAVLEEEHGVRRRAIEATDAYRAVLALGGAGLSTKEFLDLLLGVALPPVFVSGPAVEPLQRLRALELAMLVEFDVPWETALAACQRVNLLVRPDFAPVEHLLAAGFRPFGFDWAERIAVALRVSVSRERERGGLVDRLLKVLIEHQLIELLSAADGELAERLVRAVAPNNGAAGGLAVASTIWAEVRAAAATGLGAIEGELDPGQYQPERPPFS